MVQGQKKTPKSQTSKTTTSKAKTQKATTNTVSKTTQNKPVSKTTQNTTTPKDTKPKTRHFYVYYNGEKLSSRLSGKRPKQAAQKAISSIVKLHKDLIGKEIEFYIVETGRKKYKLKKVGGKTKRVPLIKRQFYYKGIRKHIPEDPNDEYYKPKTIQKGEHKGEIRKMDLELDENGKVKAIKIKRNEKDIKITKKDKDGKEIVVNKHIDGGEVKHSFITIVKADRTHKQEKAPKQVKDTKKPTTKKDTKKPTKKTTKKDTKKPTKKTTTKKTTTKKSTTKKSK